MTVINFFPVLQRPWAGYSAPGLPVGMWIAQGTSLGDASGGDNRIIFVFKAEGDPLGARFWNIEQIEIHTTLGTERNAVMSLVNLEIVGQTGLVNREIHIELDASGTGSAALSNLLPLPIFMGRPQLVDLEAQIVLEFTNTDLNTIFFTAQGYIWEPRSLLVDGGLRRPIDSLYGR